MKKLFLIIISLICFVWSCKKERSTNPTNTYQAPTPSQDRTHDSRLIGGWVMDSVLNNVMIINPHNGAFLLGQIAPLSDSIHFSNYYESYAYLANGIYISTTIYVNEKWETRYSESLFIHSLGLSTEYMTYNYSVNNNSLSISFIDTIGIDHPFIYFYNKH